MRDPVGPQFDRQHGVVTRQNALDAGLTVRQIRSRVLKGDWVELFPGVYRHRARPVTPEMTIMASLLSAGPNAVASHQSAAYLWGLIDWRAAGERPAVTVPLPGHPRLDGVDVHRTNDLPWERVRRWKGVECTDPLWTVFDCAAVLTQDLLDSVIDRALASKLVTVVGLEAEIRRRSRPGRRGGGVLRERLRQRGFTGAPHPSVLESRALRFLRQFLLPVQRCEVRAGPDGEYRLDILLEPPVVWELDGYVWHFSPEHAARDEDRRNQLRLAGYHVYVCNWLMLQRAPARQAATLRRAIHLARSAPVRTPTG